MTARARWIAVSFALCIGAVVVVVHQQSRLSALREQRRAVLARLESGTPGEAISPEEAGVQATQDENVASPEALRIRSEITRLSALKLQLGEAEQENRRLKAQLAQTGTNLAERVPVPEGYVTRRSARMAGFGRPEDTVETLLWAIEKGDTATLMQAFSPEAEKGIQEQFERAAGGAEEVFRQMRIVPGMAIAAKRSVDNNAVELDVIIIPGDPPQQIRMRFIDGQWRLLAF